jgi:outer membrane lipoprotein-sorting protein
MRNRLLTSALVLLTLVAYAGTPEEQGLAIAMAAERADAGWADSTANLEMLLTSARGEQTRRRLRYRLLEQPSDGDKAMIVFDDPADVKGTALLTYTHKVGEDDQWLYLPALKRVKRIAANNKAGPFVASEFAYEDLASQEVEKYRHKYLRDEMLSGRDCFVLERMPVDPESGYARQTIWLDKADYRQWQVAYFDRKNEPLKTLVASDFKQYAGKYWRPSILDMSNTQTGKRTRLTFSNYSFGAKLSERDFDRNSLQDAR